MGLWLSPEVLTRDPIISPRALARGLIMVEGRAKALGLIMVEGQAKALGLIMGSRVDTSGDSQNTMR